MPAVALTDHGNLFGAVEFYDKAVKAGVKPIVGCEIYLSAGAMEDGEAKSRGRKNFHLTVLSGNAEGYHNLLKISSAAYLRGLHGRPRVDKAFLGAHASGLLALSGCLSGEIPQALLAGDMAGAEALADGYAAIFGKGRFFLEIMDHGTDLQRQANLGLVELSKRTGLPLVATNDVHYLMPEDARAHDALICIGSGALLSEVKRRRYPSEKFYLRTPQEMQEVFRDFPAALKATREIADQCHLELPLGQWHLPDFQTGDPRPNREFLRDLCLKGLSARYGASTKAQRDRLDYELGVISEMGFTNYFMIVWDLVKHARDKGIPVGPGRGSAASSIVAYCLGITAVDPLRYELVFERFLERSRVTQPDIDLDFCQQRRDEVLAYIRGKYGNDCVAQIITFGTMAARLVVRDVGRVLDIPPIEIDVLAKKIPAGPNQTLGEAMKQEAELRAAFEADERYRELLEISLKLEGLSRHASTHAAGVVIADKDLSDYVPLYRGERGVLTQYPGELMERIGLLKIDVLGLETLTLLARCVDHVRERTGARVELEKLPLDDPQAYALLGRGETVGVFKCESAGMRDLMMRMRPDRIDDVIAAIALYRPGPIESGMIDIFLKGKRGEKVDYLHPLMEEVVKPTYGVIVYQEQVMQLGNRMAGFTMAEADTLRKAMGKKVREILERNREKFIEGAVRNKVPRPTAEKVFDLIAHFGGYGFNKAHSTAYAMICYQTAWLKAHHPTEFMAAALTSVMEKTEKVVSYLDECRRMGIEVLPPSVNASEHGFRVEGDRRIRYALGAIRNVGDKAVETLLAARKAGGPFRSLSDLCERADLRLVNAAVAEHLAKAGAFDDFGARRSQLMAGMERALQAAQSLQQDRKRGQATFFGGAGEKEALPDIPEWPEGQKLAHEKEALGFYMSSHPLARHAEALKRFSTGTTAAMVGMDDGQEVILGGIITKLKRTTAKKGKSEGQRMAILSFEDLAGACEGVVFPGTYATHAHLLAPDRIVFLQGRVDRQRDEPSLKVNAVVPIDEAFEVFTGAVKVSAPRAMDEAWILTLRNLLREHPGECPVYLEMEDRPVTERLVQVGNELFVTPSSRLLEGLIGLVGASRVQLSARRRVPESARPSKPAASRNAVPF